MPSDQNMSRMNPGSSCRKRCMIAEPHDRRLDDEARLPQVVAGTIGKAARVGGAFRRLIPNSQNEWHWPQTCAERRGSSRAGCTMLASDAFVRCKA
jgi:hypothetical protein